MVRRSFSLHMEGLSPAALALNLTADRVCVGGRNIFKVFGINISDQDDQPGRFVELVNLRVPPPGKNVNLNYSCCDVAWSPHEEGLIASAATNGAVCLWDLAKPMRSKLDHVFPDHKRQCQKVIFHKTDQNVILSGSQDGHMKLFDLRSRELAADFSSGPNGAAIYDIDFNPHFSPQFSAVSDNGRVAVWDMRRCDRAEKHWPGHAEYTFTCRWHPEIADCLATGGRDKNLKIWNTSGTRPSLDSLISTLGPVGQVRWRPTSRMQIARGQ